MENTNLIEQLRVYPIDFEQEDSNNVKLAISFWQRVNISYLEKLFDLGFTVEQLRGIIYGINAIQKLKADTEFSYNGIIRMRDDYPNKTLQSIISNAQIGVYESGLKYPKVGYNVIQSVFEKYGISLTPITINTTRLSIKGIEKEVTLTLFTSHEIIILYLQDEFDHKNNIEAVNGGYWGIISGDRDLLPSLLIDLFDNHDCYVKDLDLYYNGLSYGYEFLKDKNIITLQNGEFKINTMENNSAEPIVENIETTIEPNETENNTKEFSILSDTLKILFSAENKNSVWEKQVALNAGKMQLLVEKEPSLFPLYVTEMLAVPKKQRASINPYDKQTWKTDTVTNWLQAEDKNLLDFMPIREYDLPKYKPFETTHEDNTFMAIHDTFVSKDDGMRIALFGTNFSIDGITSTDANKLLFTPFRGNKYEGEPKIFCHTKKCFEKENEVVKAKYPDYKAILPNLYGSKYLLNTFAIYNFLKNVSELGLLSNIYSVGLTYYNKIVEKNDLIEFRAHLLLESIASLVKLGHTELEIGINLPNQGAIIYPAKKLTEALKLQEDFALVMPIATNLQHHELNYELETNCVTCGESTIKYCFDLVATKEKKRLEHANKLEAELADTKNKLAQTTSVLTGVIEADKAKAEAEQQAIIEAEERAEANRIAQETEAEAERTRYNEMGIERLRLDEEQRIADEIEAQRIAAMTSQDYQNLIDEVSPMLELVDEAQKADWKEYIDSLTTLMELKAEEEKVAQEAERQKQELILKAQTITYSPDENTYVEELHGSKIVNIKKGKHKGHYVITKAGAILNEKGEVNDDKTKAFVLAKIKPAQKVEESIAEELKHIRTPKKEWKISFENAETKELKEVTVLAHSKKGAIRIARGKNDLWDGWEVIMINTDEPIEFAKGGSNLKINFKLRPETLGLHLGKYGYDDKAYRRVKNWNLDDFADYVKDYTTWEGDLSDNPPTLLKEIFVDGKLPFTVNSVTPTGANNNFYYNKYPTRGGAMYDIWEQIVKENNLQPSDENEIIKEPTPVWTAQDQQDFDEYEKLYNSLPEDTRFAKGSPLTDEMWQRNFELKGKLNLIADKEGKEMKYKDGGKVTKEHYTVNDISHHGDWIETKDKLYKSYKDGAGYSYWENTELTPDDKKVYPHRGYNYMFVSNAIKDQDSTYVKLLNELLSETNYRGYAEGGGVDENIWDRTERESDNNGNLIPKSKFNVGDMVYSWQNPDAPRQVSFKRFESWLPTGKQHENDQWKYKVSLIDDEGYTKSSKWMGENSLFKDKQDKYKDGGGVGELSEVDRKRLDVLQRKEDLDELTKSENKEYEALVEKYRKTNSYKHANSGGVEKYETLAYKTKIEAEKSEKEIKDYFEKRFLKSKIVFGKDERGDEGHKVYYELKKEQYEKDGGVEGIIASGTMNTEDGEIKGSVRKNYLDGMYDVVIDGSMYGMHKTPEDAIDELEGAGFKNVQKYAEGGGVDDNTFTYMMLGRLQSDCDYFLGNGNRSEKSLWAGNVDDQIKEMKKLWNQLPEDKKPEWLSMEEILDYEKKMKEQYAKGGKVGNMHIYVAEIASQTGLREEGIERYINENNLTEPDVLKIVFGLGTLKILPIDMATAVSGTKDNAYSKKIIAFTKSKDVFKKMAQGGAVDDKEESEKKDYHKCGKGTKIQSLVFDKATFDRSSAKKWAKENNFLHNKSDITENKVRLRQVSPTLFKRKSFKTIELTTGVQAVIGCPKKP